MLRAETQRQFESRLILWLCALLLVFGLTFHLSALWGYVLHNDEPFWMLRGEWLLQQIENRRWESLREDFWNVRQKSDSGPVYWTTMGTGTPAALLTGLGQRLTGTEQSLGLKRVVGARVLHNLLGAATPLLLVLLGIYCGMNWRGALALGVFLVLNPQLRTYTSISHLESILTLFVSGSMLLFIAGRQRKCWWLISAAGIAYGIAFATRVNAAAAFLGLLGFLILRASLRWGRGDRQWREWGGQQFLWFGVLGFLVFVVLFPPIWTRPVTGFLDFIVQHHLAPSVAQPGEVLHALFPYSRVWINQIFVPLALAGLFLPRVRQNQLFQLSGVFFLVSLVILSQGTTGASPRYHTSAMPALGLAGAIAAAEIWSRLALDRFRTAILFLCTFLIVTISAICLVREWNRVQELQTLSERIPLEEISMIYSWDGQISLSRPGGTGKRLHLRSAAWHVYLVYLQVGITDLRRHDFWISGWDLTTPTSIVQCRRGDWMIAESAIPMVDLVAEARFHTLVYGQCP